MGTKNDEKVMQLKSLIEKRREELGKLQVNEIETNLVIDFMGQKHNLNVLSENDLKLMLVRLHSYKSAMNELDIVAEISGYTVDQWMSDIKTKLVTIEYKKKKKELEDNEKLLDKLLSDEKKVELELERIMESLNKSSV